MIPVTPDTKVTVTQHEFMAAARVFTAGLTADDDVICENIEGWDSNGSRQHDIRQATFDTKESAGVYIGTKYSPRKDLVLHVAFSDNSYRDQRLVILENRLAYLPFWLRTYHSINPSSQLVGGEGYQVYYSGYSITEVFNEGSRVAFRFESTQAVPTPY